MQSNSNPALRTHETGSSSMGYVILLGAALGVTGSLTSLGDSMERGVGDRAGGSVESSVAGIDPSLQMPTDDTNAASGDMPQMGGSSFAGLGSVAVKIRRALDYLTLSRWETVRLSHWHTDIVKGWATPDQVRARINQHFYAPAGESQRLDARAFVGGLEAYSTQGPEAARRVLLDRADEKLQPFLYRLEHGEVGLDDMPEFGYDLRRSIYEGAARQSHASYRSLSWMRPKDAKDFHGFRYLAERVFEDRITLKKKIAGYADNFGIQEIPTPRKHWSHSDALVQHPLDNIEHAALLLDAMRKDPAPYDVPAASYKALREAVDQVGDDATHIEVLSEKNPSLLAVDGRRVDLVEVATARNELASALEIYNGEVRIKMAAEIKTLLAEMRN